ncbi:MAG: group II intron reverse transcriptase/maturase [Burkholderiales bacterium]|nr:group II intron reverse transcriptase/maturase [Burkholderiales bacterium]
MMHGPEKSDLGVVAMKSVNKLGTSAESMERRPGAKGNARGRSTCRTQCRESVQRSLQRVRQRAKQAKQERFTSLLHHVTLELLDTAFSSLKRSAAAGIDGVMWRDYELDRASNLRSLHERLHRGTYRPKASRRQYIPKADGRLRPLGIAALEDKIVQAALVSVLNAVYEEDFVGFSYGFRPGRGQHDALDALAVGVESAKVNWVVDADIERFFDTVDHAWLLRFVAHRIGDPRVLKLIRQWLRAGVMEDGSIKETLEGTPQGAVISPLLANIYLHYVFDVWVQQWRKRHAQGRMIVVRYADDIVLGFSHEQDARRFVVALTERLASFALRLHPAKTRLLEFGRYATKNRAMLGLGKPETFTFLGFTHISGVDRVGGFQLLRHTRRDRLRATLARIKLLLTRRMHWSIPEQGRWLAQVVRGWFGYHAVPTNYRALEAFRHYVVVLWRRTLDRRSQKAHITWSRMTQIATDYLPPARISHPWPRVRFAANHPRWEPGA